MKYFFSILLMVIFFSCNSNDKTPDVSNIKVELKTMRFENFDKIDLLNIKFGNFRTHDDFIERRQMNLFCK